MKDSRGQEKNYGYLYWVLLFTIFIIVIITLFIFDNQKTELTKKEEFSVSSESKDISEVFSSKIKISDKYIIQNIDKGIKITPKSDWDLNAYTSKSITVKMTDESSAKNYFNNNINILNDVGLSLEKKSDIFIDDNLVNVFSIDFTQSYLPTGGGFMYLYYMKNSLDSYFVVEQVASTEKEIMTNLKEVKEILRQLIS